jgi:hypothetical protein
MYQADRFTSFFGVDPSKAQVEVMISRLALLMIQFGLFTAIVCAKMIYYAIFSH